MMLDLAGLPKNVNGFRTTHTCELCGFEPKTKNKYREKQDHLVMKHFKEKIDKIFPHCRPYACPAANCPFTGKDKQALLRHYTGKHGILERYLREALAEKGIHYSPGEGGKRRHSDASSNGSTGSGRGGKTPRLSVSPPQQVQTHHPAQLQQVPNGATFIAANGEVVTAKPVTLPARANAEELRREVEAMMRSFQPVVDQPVTVLQIPSSAISTANGTISIATSSHGSVNGTNGQVVTAIPIIQSTTNGGTVMATAASTATVVPVASLPAIVLSAVANATAASVAAKNGSSSGGSVSAVAPVNVVSGVSLPTQPTEVPTISVTSQGTTMSTGNLLQASQQSNGDGKQHQHQQQPLESFAPVASLIANGPAPNAIPLPIEVVNGTAKIAGESVRIVSTGNNGNNVVMVSSGGPLPPASSIVSKSSSVNGNAEEVLTSSVVENEDVMWSAVNAAVAASTMVSTAGHHSCGPAVVVEAAQTVPVAYVEGVGDFVSIAGNGVASSSSSGASGGTAVTIDGIDYDYLTLAGGGDATTGIGGIVQTTRQLDFCML